MKNLFKVSAGLINITAAVILFALMGVNVNAQVSSFLRKDTDGSYRYGVKDNTGKIIVPPKYDKMGKFCEGLAVVVLNDKYGYIDSTGKEVIPVKYDAARDFSEGLAIVVRKYDSKCVFIDKTGKEITEFKYLPTQTSSFSEGLAKVAKTTYEQGYIDKTGKEIIPLIYSTAYDFEGGKAQVILDGRKFYIDKTGKEVTKKGSDSKKINKGGKK